MSPPPSAPRSGARATPARSSTPSAGCTPSEPGYTWWDYRAGHFHKGLGLRIDLALAERRARRARDPLRHRAPLSQGRQALRPRAARGRVGCVNGPRGGRFTGGCAFPAGARATVARMRRTKIVATIGPACRDPGGPRPHGRGRARRRAAELLPRQPRGARGERRARARRRQARRAAGRDPPGPAGSQAADRPAARGPRRPEAGRAADAALRQRRAGRRGAAVGQLGRPRRPPSRRTTSSTSPTARIRLRVERGARRARSTRPSRSAGRSPRARGSTSRARRAACRRCPHEDLELLRFGESIGVDMVALSFVREPSDVMEVRKHTRTPLIAKIEKPQAVEDAEEIIRVGRLRDGRPRRSGHRAADRGRAGRAEAAAARSPASSRGRRSPRRRCSTRWSPPRARRAPR